MDRPSAESPFPDSHLGSLLALLELGRVGDDPIDKPTPWAWGAWRNGLRSEYAPWQLNATRENTHMFDHARHHSRLFVIAYHASGRNLQDRVRFARDLTEGDGDLYKGREWLTSWWTCQRYGDIMNLDDRINDILTQNGVLTSVRSVVELDIAILSGTPHPVVVLGRALFGDDVWGSGPLRHPAVLRWLGHTLDITRRDWITIYNDNHRRVDRMRDMIYTMCQDVLTYVAKLGYIVDMMDFVRVDGRMEQVTHYRKILYAIEESMGAWGASATSALLPPNMVRTLARMPSEAYRKMLKSEVAKCLKILDLRAVQSSVMPVDVYDLLSRADVGFLAGEIEGTNEENAGHLALEWQDENTLAGLAFAKCTLPRVW
ncbi:hypothetical protein GSI_08561 [Ganoderma sinense ZZ0214-1]|uniref:Uncharacterized protein n=1 Tax=Ganoderma sinense ZZ0214-1 TaxID=1077348 RepID=A0A2G8S411_9APHY|nr:hypothetical protein GSI_08561 [Ganoderma sinense ZZ0214-1]